MQEWFARFAVMPEERGIKKGHFRGFIINYVWMPPLGILKIEWGNTLWPIVHNETVKWLCKHLLIKTQLFLFRIFAYQLPRYLYSYSIKKVLKNSISILKTAFSVLKGIYTCESVKHIGTLNAYAFKQYLLLKNGTSEITSRKRSLLFNGSTVACLYL